MKNNAKPSLGIIPLGTVNNFARSLRIPVDAQEAIHMLLNTKFLPIDTAKIEDTYFISSVSAGPTPETIQQVGTELKTKFGPIANLLEGVKALDEKKCILFEWYLMTKNGNKFTV